MSYILNRSTVYEKPWQSRRLIARLIGEGMLAAEGNIHKRQVCRPMSKMRFEYFNTIHFFSAESLKSCLLTTKLERVSPYILSESRRGKPNAHNLDVTSSSRIVA